MQIEHNKPLAQYNTFGIQATAKFFTEITSVEDFRELLSNTTYGTQPKLVLGGGSNILLTKDFNGLVIKNAIPGIVVVTENETTITVKAGAGVVWHQLVLWCIERNYGGIENLSLIPGLVGAAPMQNIGAYGVELKDVFEQLEAIDVITGELITLGPDDCKFGYRESIFKHHHKNRFLITAVSIKLAKVDAPHAYYRFKTDYGDIKATLAEDMIFDLNLKAISNAIIKIRSAKLPDPKVLGNAGSFFKNPSIGKEQFDALVAKNPLTPGYQQKDGTVKVPAGWLIEQCGWKGKVVGHTGAHAKQALVLVNYGNATGSEVLQLAKEIQQSVMDKFGIEILPEVNIV